MIIVTVDYVVGLVTKAKGGIKVIEEKKRWKIQQQ